jgi:hypothetical protein
VLGKTRYSLADAGAPTRDELAHASAFLVDGGLAEMFKFMHAGKEALSASGRYRRRAALGELRRGSREDGDGGSPGVRACVCEAAIT